MVKSSSLEASDPTWKCGLNISKGISDATVSRRSERMPRKSHSASSIDLENKLSKTCPEASDDEPQQSVGSTSKNVSEACTAAVQAPTEIPTTAAQLFLVAQKSPNQEEQIIHVYMVSPAGAEHLSAPTIANLPQAVPGITLLNAKLTSCEVIPEASIEQMPGGDTIHTEIIIDSEPLLQI